MKYTARILLIAAVATLAAACGGDKAPIYKDATQSVDARVKDLLGRMTPLEKIGQLICPLGWPMYEKFNADATAGGQDSVAITDLYRHFVDSLGGGMLWAAFRADPWTRKTLETGLNPTLAAKTYNLLQKYSIEHSRLGIPIILAEEAPHGHMAIGTTVFPTSIGLASTWNPETMEQVGKVIARELRAQGGHISYGPVIDLAREPRWSRVEETYGEDVFLTSTMAAGMMQGTSPKNNGWNKGVISTLKHFIAYGIPEGGHNGNPSFVGQRDLYENFLPTFKAAIDAGALSVMTSYNAIDGEPTTGNRALLTDLLRGEWGFDGFVVSDLQSVDGLANDHRIAADLREAGEMALKAGVDVDLGANCFSLLEKSLKEGKITEKDLDIAAGRVLKIKFQLGLFDNPYIPEEDVQVRTPENIEVARKAALESVTLLENNGVLPLSKNIKVAVVGPNADNMYNQLGDYTAPQERSNIVTMLDGTKAKIGPQNVIYAKGCAVRDEAWNGIPEAVLAALRADVVVAVVGGSSARDFKTKYIDTGAAVVDDKTVSDMEAGEGFDRASLDLLGRQNALLKALKATGKPLVVVHIEGRPLDKAWQKENADALLTLWYPGQEGGNALADVLFGDYNPAGRLPVTVPRSVGQLPVYYNKKFPFGHDYVEMPSNGLYEFGYGLSYTKFDYSDLKIVKTGDDTATVSVTITNTGDYDGEEVVQLYITDQKASTVRPRKQLRGFRRLYIPKGSASRIAFELDREAFLVYDKEMKPVVEPGDFTIGIGASSEDIRLSGVLTL
ncbi:MAG: glycoside hydrolase family 3 N-terminal domain-containing protein [Bacteroidales bacterium]|nr:glycoside hydrolase family 3 N-terminal domain-containing protein [Bacteroidales bacterium]